MNNLFNIEAELHGIRVCLGKIVYELQIRNEHDAALKKMVEEEFNEKEEVKK
jgi:hypothetical protein